jgi:hypothetical protein
MSIDLTRLVADMQSPDPLTQGPALKEAARVTKVLASEAVKALAVSPAPAAAADQLSSFGSIEPLLESLMRQDVNCEAKSFAATLLLHFGSKVGVGYLLGALRRGEGPTLHIAMWLGKAGVTEAAEVIEEILKRWDLRLDPHGAATLIDALKGLTVTLPDGIRARVETEAMDPYRTSLLKLWGG